MKRILCVSIIAIALGGCATVEEEKIDDVPVAECEKFDENGDCVEGGGPTVIVG